MKIEELFIEGFGHFASQRVGPFTGPVSVIYGPNEAGKSTLLAFIRNILFGFPSSRSNSYYAPLSGGQHGGRITLADDEGLRYIVERFRGVRGGPVNLRTYDGAPVNETELTRLLGGASSDVFKNVFAFSLEELQNEKSLSGADVDSQIYSAGLGAARLPEALRTISQNKEKIFRTTRARTLVSESLSQLDEVTEKIKQVEGNAAEYGRLIGRQVDIERELETVNAERASLGRQAADNGRLIQGWEDWVSLVDIEDSLKERPKFDEFPEEAASRLTNAEDRVSDARLNHEEFVEQLEKAEGSEQEEIGQEELLQRGDAIENIRRGRNRFDDSIRDLPERTAELQSLEKSLGERLRDIGPDWDEERLESFDTSIATRDHIEQVRLAMAGKIVVVQQRTSQSDQAKQALLELEERENQARKIAEEHEEPALDGVALEQKRSALRRTRTRFDEFARLRLRHSDLRGQLESSTGHTRVDSQSSWIKVRWLPLLLGVAAISLIAVSATLGQQQLIFGAIAGASLLIAAAYIYLTTGQAAVGGTPPGSQALFNNVSRAEAEESDAAQRLRDASAALDLDLPEAVALDELESALAASDTALRAWENVQLRLTEAIEGRQQQERREENATNAQAAAQDELKAAQAEWQTWLIDRGLAETLTPETMVGFRGSVETTRVALGEVRTMRQRIGAIEHDIDEYTELIEPLAEEFDVEARTEGGRRIIAAAADALITQYESVRASVERRENVRDEIKTIRQQVEQREKQLEEAEDVLAQLLHLGGADDPEEFRRRAYQHRERQELERRSNEHLVRLQQLSGPGEALERYRETLAQTNPQSMQEESDRLEEGGQSIEACERDLLAELGEIRTLVSQLTTEEESSALRVRRNTLIEDLQANALEWSKLALAEELLRRTRLKFEEDRQPGVIQHAQRFFAIITDHRYDRLYAPIGEQTITVIDRNGVSKQPSELSQGTREQLYLSLRFALIRQFGEQTVGLPVVIDEVLVNFDPGRARRAAEAFVELSETNQILVFTCHPEMVDLFTGVAPQTQVIHIDSGE